MNRIFLLALTILFFSVNVFAQNNKITLSGRVIDGQRKAAIPFANIVVLKNTDSSFVAGTISNDEGRFSLAELAPGNYIIKFSKAGYATLFQPVLIGSLSSFLDIGSIELQIEAKQLDAVVVTATVAELSNKMDKKTFSVADNISQSGGSVLQVLKNLPGITSSQDGKVELRGSDKVAILIDGKQTALTGFGGQTGLDNIPASAIERIEIINNPSAKYDANGNAGIINIIYKKNKQQGFNGKVGLTTGLGALWQKKENLPTIRPQYQRTPKINPSLSLNYRKNKVNAFLQADWLYTETLLSLIHISEPTRPY